MFLDFGLYIYFVYGTIYNYDLSILDNWIMFIYFEDYLYPLKTIYI